MSKTLLQDLVNSRLLRAEPRVGSTYYELSHDTLVTPIRKSQKKRQNVSRIISLILLFSVLLPGGFFLWKQWYFNTASRLAEAKRQYALALLTDDPIGYYKAALKELDAAITRDPSLLQAYALKGLIYTNRMVHFPQPCQGP